MYLHLGVKIEEEFSRRGGSVANCWDDRLIGFSVATGEWSNFKLFHRLSPSSLQGSRTTLPACI